MKLLGGGGDGGEDEVTLAGIGEESRNLLIGVVTGELESTSSDEDGWGVGGGFEGAGELEDMSADVGRGDRKGDLS
jgi:hypothetical protein